MLAGERQSARIHGALATDRRVSASTQNQALAALLFLYQRVLERQIEWLEGIVHAKLIVRDGKGRKDRATLSSTSATSMPSTCAQVPATSSYRTPCASSTRPPRASGLGSGSSQRPATTPTPRQASAAATTFTRASSSAPSARPPGPPAFQDP
jgi:hypothetical protein